MENFIYQSSKTIVVNQFADLTCITGHFDNCFDQSYYVVSFHFGKDSVVFYFNKLQLALDFFNKYSKKHHSFKFMLSRLQSYHNCNYVYKLLFDDSINKVRFENPSKQKVIEFYASSTSDIVSFTLTPNGEFSYTIQPIQKSRE